MEYFRLGIGYREHRILTVSFTIKLLFFIVELALAIAFGVTTRGRRKNQAAVIEWGKPTSTNPQRHAIPNSPC